MSTPGNACPPNSGKLLETYHYEKRNYWECQELWPSVTYDNICDYFVGRPGFDGEAVKAYKSLNAFLYVTSGKVHSILVSVPEPGYIILKGTVSPSQRSSAPYVCWVVIETCGKIRDATCTCMAGLGECCSHAAAVCFVLEAWNKEKVETPVPTDIPCQWLAPRLKRVQPKAANQLNYTRDTRDGHKQSVLPQPVKQTPEPDSSAFIAALRKVAPTARFFTAVDVNPAHNNLPEHVQTPEQCFHYNITLSQPLSKFRPPSDCTSALTMLRITNEDSQAIEAATRQQRNSSAWFEHRKGRITASIFKEVCASRMTKCTSLINKIFRPTFINTAAVQYGIENEESAKRTALEIFSLSHQNARMEDCGLMVPPSYPYLGCSPDALLHCDCHAPAVLEVKCIYSLKSVDPSSMIEEGQKLAHFCLDSHGQMKHTHKYYYQVQAQIHLNTAGCDMCYLYLHVDKGGLLVPIEKDNEFMVHKKPKLEEFFTKIVLPRLCSLR
ncbi:uncharacterized protein LOC135386417 [Ornithodoros turicata]|uniref:uncharacterized protein LOC135386417 n=1 Tax=Ornithodoros turicata TaxID=34597 RepID=UPI00313A3FB4